MALANALSAARRRRQSSRPMRPGTLQRHQLRTLIVMSLARRTATSLATAETSDGKPMATAGIRYVDKKALQSKYGCLRPA